MARPALATAPKVKTKRRPPDASHIESPNGIWGVVDAKKSISFPIVKGMLIDTAEETKRSPMAVRRGFCSGFARANMRRTETFEGGPLEAKDAGRKRVMNDPLGDAFVSVGGVDSVE